MDNLPAVDVSPALLFAAAGEVFGVPARAIRNFSIGAGNVLLARDACAWVVDQLVDGSDSDRQRLLGGRKHGWFRGAVERARRFRDEDADFRLKTEGMLASVFGIGRLKLAGNISGIDTAEEARRIARDPLRAVKNAPVMVLAAIVEDHVDALDVLDLVREWQLAEAAGEDAGMRDALRLAVLDALGIDGEAADAAA